jgi:hypothetical protein
MPLEVNQFSDIEVQQLEAVVKEELQRRGEWMIANIGRRRSNPRIVDVDISRVGDSTTTLIIELPYEEYSRYELDNESQLTDPVFNVSIRLLEFDDIRGFEGFPSGATVSLDVYGHLDQKE